MTSQTLPSWIGLAPGIPDMGAIHESYISTDLKRRVGVPRALPACNIPAWSPAVVMGRAGREITAAAPTTRMLTIPPLAGGSGPA